MTTASPPTPETDIPDDVARAAVLPESYGDPQGTVYPAFAWLRENAPVAKAEIEGFDPLWLVTKLDDVLTVERDARLFNASANNVILNTRAGDDFLRSVSGGTTRTMDMLPWMDPPEHTAIKAATSGWFRPKNVGRFAEQIRQIAKEDVERLLERDGRCDWTRDFALQYPLRVIMTIFGAPMEDLPMLMTLTQEFFGSTDPDEQRAGTEVSPQQAAQQFHAAKEDFYAYFRQFTADRRADPKDDLMSALANSTVDGELLTDSFVNGLYLAVATAGHDTSAATIAGAGVGLARHPDQWRALRSDPALIDGLVEESVRWTSPVRHFMRTASEDTTLRGAPIRAGDRLMLSYPSANRDEEHFDRPEEFDIQRSPNKHVGFGYGAHMCIGSAVARLEMKILWEELLPRITSLELTGEPVSLKANFVSGYKKVPMAFTAA